MSKLVFFYLADCEILDLSEAREHISEVLAALNLELRLLVLLIDMDDCVVLSPSHYREEEICRELVGRNLPFVNEGYLGLAMREATLEHNKDKQAERYKDFGHFEKYRLSYLSNTDHGLGKLDFRILSKDFRTGKTTLDIWERRIRDRATYIGYPPHCLEELVRRIREDEGGPFIWERVKAILDSMNFKPAEERLLRIRASMSTSYIESHLLGGFSLPSGSMAVREVILPKSHKGNAYDLMRFRRILQQAEVFSNVSSFSPLRIVALKNKVPNILEKIRSGSEAGNSSEQIYTDLHSEGLIAELQSAIKGIVSGHMTTQAAEMQSYQPHSKVDEFLITQEEVLRRLEKKFIHYQHPEGKIINIDEIGRFLRQFETPERMSLALILLQNITFIGRDRMKEMFRHYCKQILSSEDKKKTVVTNLGGPYDSSNIVSYISADIAMELNLKALDLRAILDSEDWAERILFVDDNIGSGKQATDIFRELLGLIEEKELEEYHETKLTDIQCRKLKTLELSLFTYVGLEEGKKDLVEKLHKLGLNMEEPYSFLKQEEKIGCFHRASGIFGTKEERETCKDICGEIGYQLFADKNDWPEELKRKRSLGYGDSQKTIVFFYNVPTSSLPLLWKRGIYNGEKWEPLFPRREKIAKKAR